MVNRGWQRASIESLEELRMEQLRVKQQIELEKSNLNSNYIELKEGLSITRVVSRMMTRVSLLLPLVKAVKNGYHYLFNSSSKKRAETVDPNEEIEGDFKEIEE